MQNVIFNSFFLSKLNNNTNNGELFAGKLGLDLQHLHLLTHSMTATELNF